MSSADCPKATELLATAAATASAASPPVTSPPLTIPALTIPWPVPDLGICAPPRLRLIIQVLVIRREAKEEAVPSLCSHAGHSVRVVLCAAALLSALVPATAQQSRRATIWDLKLGEPIAAQPSPNEF